MNIKLYTELLKKQDKTTVNGVILAQEVMERLTAMQNLADICKVTMQPEMDKDSEMLLKIQTIRWMENLIAIPETDQRKAEMKEREEENKKRSFEAAYKTLAMQVDSFKDELIENKKPLKEILQNCGKILFQSYITMRETVIPVEDLGKGDK